MRARLLRSAQEERQARLVLQRDGRVLGHLQFYGEIARASRTSRAGPAKLLTATPTWSSSG
jgi:hypothetical protein